MKITSTTNTKRRSRHIRHTEADGIHEWSSKGHERVGIVRDGSGSIVLYTIGDFSQRRYRVELSPEDVKRFVKLATE